MKSPADRILSWLVTLLVPVAIVLTAVRIMLSGWYPPFEYNRPNFPADPYGFTKEERLYWSRLAEDYLLNNAGISFLADLHFADGQPVYNERELRHMVDVKRTVKAALAVWYASLIGLVGLGIWAWRGGWKNEYRRGLSRGGWLTILILVAVLLFVFFGFDAFFVAFHDVFFQPGTWMFLWSDTLIRLFPEKFWQDIFILVGIFSLVAGLLVAVLARPRRAASKPPVGA